MRRIGGLSRQRGVVLILLLLVLGVGALALLVTGLNRATPRLERDRVTSEALARAKEALIGFAVSDRPPPRKPMPGALPCPDIDNDGSADTLYGGSCTAYIGRLPWKELGIPDLRDVAGECLWYALSPVFRNAMPVSNRGTAANRLNSNTAGTLSVYDGNGAVLAAPVIAVVIAPGAPLPGQTRSNAGTPICRGNNNPANYLDSANGIDNATGNKSGVNYSFVALAATPAFNDRVAFIAPEQLFGPLRKRIAAEIAGRGTPPATGLRHHYAGNHAYPWAGDAGGNAMPGRNSGGVAYQGLSFDADILEWLVRNNWFALTSYQVGTDFQPGAAYPQQCTPAGCPSVRGQQAQAGVTVGGGAAAWAARICVTNPAVAACPGR